jgi:hypothetical protein
MTTYVEIPYVPQNVDDPSAAINEALRVLRALAHTCVKSMALSAPPGVNTDGDMYIVGATPTGDWSGFTDYLAQYVEESDSWDFFEPGTLAKIVLNLANGVIYYYDIDTPTSGWQPAQLGT